MDAHSVRYAYDEYVRLADESNVKLGVFTSELRVHVVAADVATYPDITILCGARAIDLLERNAVVDATELVEVLSPSTEDYDRGAPRRDRRRTRRPRALRRCGAAGLTRLS